MTNQVGVKAVVKCLCVYDVPIATTAATIAVSKFKNLPRKKQKNGKIER